jgi:hypothetical protein
LVFVKSDHSLKDLMNDLPVSLEFVVRGRHEIVTAGYVRRRDEAPAMLLAGPPWPPGGSQADASYVKNDSASPMGVR